MLTFIIGIQIFFLIFVRLMALFSTTTFWGSRLILLRMRVLIAFFVTVLLFPMVREVYMESFPVGWPIFWFWIMNNILIGLAFGFLITLFFSLFQIAGQFFSFQMGFAISQVLDPLSQEQMPVIGQMMALIALLVFLAVNGHTQTIQLLYNSFKDIPLLNLTKDIPGFLDQTLEFFGYMFGAALQFAITIMGSILIATLFIGLLSKAAPQINAMLFGFPLYIGLGFLLMSFLATNIVNFMGNYIDGFFSKLMLLFK